LSGTRLIKINQYKLKQLLLKFCVFLLVVGGLPLASPAQVQAADPFEINNVDSYGISMNIVDHTFHQIRQFDGNNFNPDPKAMVLITGLPSGASVFNGLVVHPTENALYAYGTAPGTPHALFRITPDGAAQIVGALDGPAGNADITEDGTLYYYSYVENGQLLLGSYNLATGEKKSTPINGYPSNDIGGDMVIDGEGYIWFANNNAGSIIQLDPQNGDVLRQVPITSGDGVALEGGVRGLSFLPNGQMLLSSGPDNRATYFSLNPETLQTTFLGSVTISGEGRFFPSYDLASRIYPTFDPNPPVLESSKTAKIQAKAAGNTDVDHPEEGDTLLYTIQTRNTVANSLVKNLMISDKIPEGLEYVPGTLTVDGTSVSDDPNDDQGEFVDPNVIGRFGDVTDTGSHTITFEVTVKSGQAGNTIENIAAVTGDNLITPDEPKTSVGVYPLDRPEPPDACAAPVALINGEFEEPEGPGTYDNSVAGGGYYYADTVPGWNTTDFTRTPRGIIQIMDPARPSTIPANTPNRDNLTSRFAELNADTNSMLYQELPTVPGQTIYWRLDHRGYSGVDTMSVNIGPATGDPLTTPEIQRLSDGTTWNTYSGVYTVPAGQTVTRFGFMAISTSTGALAFGNYLDNIFLGTEPCVVAEKTVSPNGEVFVGDELTYEVTIKNNGGDIAANTVFEDAIPTGTEYIPGSLKIVSGPNAGDLTDADDQDAGHFDGQKVIIELGDLPNTTNLPDGITVQFKVKALSDRAGDSVSNRANVGYKNLLTNEDKTTPSNEVTTSVEYREPKLEATKTAELFEKATGNTDATHPEVGDTLLYTIQTRNTVTDSRVTNLTISDEIPAGLEYVAGTLKVDGQEVTDAQGDDDGHFADGKVFAQFGDVMGTEAHKVTFQVKVLPGQAGKDIRNVAVVDGDNITTPSTPEEVVEVYPRETALESKKTAELFEKAAGNTDAAHPEVGDTLLYTIQTRNTASDSRVTNLRITDEIPAGLEYVPGTLKVDDAAVTDAQGDDKGHFANGKIFAGFGDVTDTEWHKVTFQVKVLPGQAGKNIINIAAVEGDNVGTPDRPRNEVEVYPRNPQIETDKSVANTNVSKATYEVGDTITYTIRVRGVVNDTYLENLTITDSLPAGLEYVPGSLKVDGVTVTDPKDDDAGHSVTGDVYGSFGNIDDTNWHTLEFQAIILPGQGGLTIENTARVTGDNIDQPGEPTEKMVVEPEPPVEPPIEPPVEPPVNPPVDPDPPVNPPLDPDPPVTPPVTPPAPVMESRKTSRDLSGGTITVGDTLEYTISARNTVAGSYVSNLVIADTLPEGLAYVAGSLKVDGVSVTDLADGDKGQYVNGKVSGNFGRITDTEWHTITFQATVKAGQAGESIENIGEVTGDNVTTPEKPFNVIEVTDNENNGDNNTNPGGTGDSDNDSNEDPNGNSSDDTDGDSNGNPDEDSNGDADRDSNTGAQIPDDQSDSALGESDATPQNPAQSGDQATNEPNGNKLPNTATNMYSYMLAGFILLLAGLILIRRRKA